MVPSGVSIPDAEVGLEPPAGGFWGTGEASKTKLSPCLWSLAFRLLGHRPPLHHDTLVVARSASDSNTEVTCMLCLGAGMQGNVSWIVRCLISLVQTSLPLCSLGMP